MFKASIQMSFSTQEHDVLEMCMVDVSVHSEKSLEDYLNYTDKVLGERHSKLAWENLLIVKLVLDPSHQKIDVLLSTDFQRSFDVVTIRPEVFVFGTSGHRWTAFSCTELSEDTVENVDFIIEFDGVNSKPLIKIFSCRQLYSQLHVATTQGHSSNLL